MTPKKRRSLEKAKGKSGAKARPTRRAKPKSAPKAVARKPEPSFSVQPFERVEPPAQRSVQVTVENIRGETAIGDLLVAFPRTREILVRYGLRLEAEDAGDIYMTLDAFSALNGLKAESLVQDLITMAKEPPQQPVLPQLLTAPAN
jgi:hypothetical protein